MDMILKTIDLCKSFSGQMAVNNISLNIEKKFRLWTIGTERSWKVYNAQNDYRHFKTDLWKYRV